MHLNGRARLWRAAYEGRMMLFQLRRGTVALQFGWQTDLSAKPGGAILKEKVRPHRCAALAERLINRFARHLPRPYPAGDIG